jgi:hypothetical protein
VQKNFIQIPKDAFQAAARDLTAAQLIVWTVLAGNADNFEFFFSPAELEKDYGICKKTAQSAFKTLQDKGYLIPTKASTHFHFYLTPQTIEPAEEPTPAPVAPQQKRSHLQEVL